MAHLKSVFVHPIKSLDATPVTSATVVENGGLEFDRRYAIVDDDGEYVNGKREPLVHRLRTTVDLDTAVVTLRGGDDDPRRFHLEDDRGDLEAWLSAFFGRPVSLLRSDEGGFPDDPDASGPTVISTGTLERVASWYDGIDLEGMRRRLRPNLVIDGTPAFWEDRLYEEPGYVVPFTLGGATLHGVNPCQRCVVPTRDPDTGEPTPNFRERFVTRREATLPDWASTAWFDHYFRLMVNTRIPASSWGVDITIGDDLEAGDPVPESDL